jgi:hypothetical protein
VTSDENFIGDAYDDELLNKRKSNTGGLETVIPVICYHSAQKTEGWFRFYLLWRREGSPCQEGEGARNSQALKREDQSRVHEGVDSE